MEQLRLHPSRGQQVQVENADVRFSTLSLLSSEELEQIMVMGEVMRGPAGACVCSQRHRKAYNDIEIEVMLFVSSTAAAGMQGLAQSALHTIPPPQDMGGARGTMGAEVAARTL